MTPIEIFESHLDEPREYGLNDCCIAVANALQEPWGCDLMKLYGRAYRTQIGFLRAAKKQGCDTLAEAVELAAKNAGAIEVVEGFQDYDLAMVFAGHKGQIVELPAFYFDGAFRGMTPDGFALVFEALKAWRTQYPTL